MCEKYCKLFLKKKSRSSHEQSLALLSSKIMMLNFYVIVFILKQYETTKIKYKRDNFICIKISIS